MEAGNIPLNIEALEFFVELGHISMGIDEMGTGYITLMKEADSVNELAEVLPVLGGENLV
jgi:hypothetical protein